MRTLCMTLYYMMDVLYYMRMRYILLYMRMMRGLILHIEDAVTAH